MMKSSFALLSTICVATASAVSPVKVEARATSSATSSGSTTLPTITIKGNAFFSGNDRFYIRGVDYQPGGSSAQADPLADLSTCSRDIAYFKQLGINTIRVYTIDNSKNHDDCMHALAEAGIYLALDVNSPNYSLNRADPAPSYNPTYLQSVFATIDAFAGYTNLLLFFSGNEDVNDATNTQSAPYVKAVTRDMKQYIGERGYRSIPVGYAAADVSQNQLAMGQYLDCGDAPSRSDFYAINNYEWCSPSSFTGSGWSTLVQNYANYSLPVFFSEYGCIKNNARDFSEISVLYNTEMTSVFSGGLVYEYSNEGDGWGLVTINGNTVTEYDNQLTLLQNALAATADPANGGNYSTSGVVQDCPAQSTNWNTSPWTGTSLPAMPDGAVQYLKNGAGTAPGLSGGSQNAGGASSSTASANAGAVTTTMGSGSATGASTTSSHGAASSLRQPFPVTSDLLGLICGTSLFAFASFVFGIILI